MAPHSPSYRPRIAIGVEYPIDDNGGVCVLARELIGGLSAHFEIILASPDTQRNIEHIIHSNQIVGHVHWRVIPHSSFKSEVFANQLADLRVQTGLLNCGGNYGWGNMKIGCSPIPHLQRRGIPVITTVHSVVSVYDGYCGMQRPVWQKLALLPIGYFSKLRALKSTAFEIAVSDNNLAKLKSWYPMFRDVFVRIYHSRLSDRSNTSVTAKAPIILHVGHIAARKGQLQLVKAFARIANRHPSWHLNLVGPIADANYAESIKFYIEKNYLEERVRLAGNQSNTAHWFENAAIYAQPSLEEALGLALQEAMAANCACIGTNVGGIPELISHRRSGILVESNNVLQLAEALEELIANDGLRQELSKNAAIRIEELKMGRQCMIDGYLALIGKTMSLPNFQ